ncbi:MAG TPA: hypothetical protein VF303_02850 [Candidatus Nanoarchaeia archaeon]
MSNLIDLIQNEPIGLAVLALLVLTIAVFFAIPIFLNLVPQTAATKFREAKSNPLFFFSCLLFLLVFVTIALVLFFGSPKTKQEETKAKEQFRTEGKVLNIDSKTGIVTIQQTGSPRKFKFNTKGSITYKEAWSDKTLSSKYLAKSTVVEVLSYEPLETDEVLSSSKIVKVTIFPGLNTVPPDLEKLPDYEESEGK